MKTKVLKSLSVCGLALSLFAAGQTSAVHNFAHADGPATAVGSGTIATGKVLLQGNNSKVSLVEEVSSEGSKSTVKFFLGDKQLPGFDENAKILAQDANRVVLEESTTHAIAIVKKSQDRWSALEAYTGVELSSFIQSIKDKAAQNKNIMYDHVDTKDFTVDNKKFTVPFLQTEISKIDGGVTVLKNGIGCSYTATANGTNVMDNAGISMQKEVPSTLSIAKNNDVTVEYQGDSHTYTQNLLSFDQSSVSANKQADKSTSAPVSKSDDKAGTVSVNSDKSNNTDTKADKNATGSTSNGDKSSAKTDSLDDASSKSKSNSLSKSSSAESYIASSESSSVKSGSNSDKSNSAESKSESSSVSSSSEKLSEAKDGSDKSSVADKVSEQSSSGNSQASSQLSSVSSSENGAGNGTDSGTTVGGQGSNGFEASGINPGDSGNESGATSSAQPGADDTYSAQKAAMLAKTNAKAEGSGIVAAIEAVMGLVAGWFGLRKKKMIR